MLLPNFTQTNIINVFAPCNASKLLIAYLATHGGQLSVTFEWKDFLNAFWSDEKHREQLSPDPRPHAPSKCAIDQNVVIKRPLN